MKGRYILRANGEIRKALKESGLSLWRLGAELNVSEGTVVRWLRQELPGDEKARILLIIGLLNTEEER